MKIGVNCLMLNDEYSGLGIYSVNLMNHLAKVSEHEYYVFSAKSGIVKDLLPETFNIVHIPMKDNRISRLYAEQIKIPIIAKKLELDILFTPAFYMPLFSSCYSMVTIHDMIYKTYPEDMSLRARVNMRLFLDQSIKRADRVIAVSDWTRKDIEKYSGRTEKVCVIHEGLGNQISDAIEKPDCMEEIERFALFVGSVMPRKNVLGTVKAFEALDNKQGLKLVIAGHKGDAWENIKGYIEEKQLTSEVLLTGYVSDQELNWLYGHARMLLYCSYYEGFGFPPLEAMRNGVPVIASNRSSIPEIVGDAAITIDPDNIEEITCAIRKLDEDDEARDSLIAKGRIRVQKFSWKKTAKKTEQLLNQIEEELRR